MKEQVLVPMRVAPLAWSPAFLTGNTRDSLIEAAMYYKDHLIYQFFENDQVVRLQAKINFN